MPLPLKFKYVTRKEWGARKIKKDALLEDPEEVKHPIKIVGLTCCTHTPNFMTPSCTDTESCKPVLQKLQRYHIFEGQFDIPYNFLISQDGTVYEGRGWNTKPYKAGPFRSSKLKEYGIDVAFIGDWCHHIPELTMTKAFDDLMNHGVSRGYIKWQFKPISFKRYSDFGYKEFSKDYKRQYKKRDNKLYGKGGPIIRWGPDCM